MLIRYWEAPKLAFCLQAIKLLGLSTPEWEEEHGHRAISRAGAVLLTLEWVPIPTVVIIISPSNALAHFLCQLVGPIG